MKKPWLREDWMPRDRWIALLESVHPSSEDIPPSGRRELFNLLLDDEFFRVLPLYLFPAASLSTAGFTVFVERIPAIKMLTKYANRVELGNLTRSDVMYFKGRGIFSAGFVGRHAYTRFSEDTGINVADNPDLILTSFDVMVKVAHWQLENIIIKSQCTNTETIGKLLGLSERKSRVLKLFSKWVEKDGQDYRRTA